MNGRRRTPIAVAVVRDGERFLIGRRPEGAALAGLWEFPGGKIEPGESPEQAAVRECREESGLEVQVIGRYPITIEPYEHDRVELHFLKCQPLDTNAAPRPPFLWVERGGLADYEFPSGNRELLALIAAE